MKKSTIKHKGRSFTLIEILIVITIIGILAAMIMPSFHKARIYAKYIRWLQFNRQCSNDRSLVVNFNFQGEGEGLNQKPPGDVLLNSAVACDVEGFNATLYNGHLMNKNGGPHNFEWVRAGRFKDFKWALRFNGADTYVLIPTSTGIDFTPLTGFTVLCWVKFDKLGFGDTIFSKSLWGTTKDAAAQYDMYYNPFAGTMGNGSFDVDVFQTCGSWMNTQVDFDKAGWVHFALRYKYTHTDMNGKPHGEITCFINGQPLGDYVDTTNENPATSTATGYQPCIDMKVPLILGGAGCYTKYWARAQWDPNDPDSLGNNWVIKFNFQGLMDEFLVYKRALSDKEIEGQYEMGKP